MTLVIVDSRGRCTIEGAKEGAYDAEVEENGVVRLVPLVRATDGRAVETKPANQPRQQRRVVGRDARRIPQGTVLYGRPPIGAVTMGVRGQLSDGRSLNKTLTDAGITQNAWSAYRLSDGRTIGEAYDAGEWG